MPSTSPTAVRNVGYDFTAHTVCLCTATITQASTRTSVVSVPAPSCCAGYWRCTSSWPMLGASPIAAPPVGLPSPPHCGFESTAVQLLLLKPHDALSVGLVARKWAQLLGSRHMRQPMQLLGLERSWLRSPQLLGPQEPLAHQLLPPQQPSEVLPPQPPQPLHDAGAWSAVSARSCLAQRHHCKYTGVSTQVSDHTHVQTVARPSVRVPT